MTETDARWKDSLAAAAARAYEAAHGSAIPESRRGLRLRMSWRQAAAALVAVVALAAAAWVVGGPDAPAGVPLAPPSAAAVVVDVAGAVEAPGLVELVAGARVADALDAAGGASADAVLDDLNLARKVTDGEQIRVPREGEEGGTASGLINVNRADATQLEELPGVGPVLAARIIADREANGPFATLDDLARVPGVGDAILGGLEGVATV
jgi:competence protein ComEA